MITHTPNHSVSEQGKFRRALAFLWTFLKPLDSDFDYTSDRIDRLEREVAQLKEEVRQSRDSGPIDVHGATAAGHETLTAPEGNKSLY